LNRQRVFLSLKKWDTKIGEKLVIGFSRPRKYIVTLGVAGEADDVESNKNWFCSSMPRREDDTPPVPNTGGFFLAR
jgi:hypothetical protein